MNLADIKKLKIPANPGCYRFFDKQGKIIYIGKAVNLKNRVLSYWQKGSQLTPAKQLMLTKIERLDWLTTDSEIEALLLEANLIKKHQPYYNVNLKDDKRFIYIWVSTAHEVPGVFATRHLTKGGRYFGPFVSTLAVRETLRALRKIWPYCTQQKTRKAPCFYYQIGRCVGVCGKKVSIAQYKQQVIKPIIEFLEGRKERIIKNYELRIKNLEKQAKVSSSPLIRGRSGGGQSGVSDELAQLKWQLLNMKQVLANARVLSVGEKYAADVVELAKILNLPKIPRRIEGYDISNPPNGRAGIFSQEAVGSMVVFSGGEPDKSEYKKFKIKLDNIVMLEGAQRPIASLSNNKILSLRSRMTGKKHGDVQMLEEMLERRFRHSPSPDVSSSVIPAKAGIQPINNRSWPLPDLIVVDGGKAQLNVALKVLKKNKLDIPVLGISKGEALRSAGAPDKIFFPNQASALQLPLNSPALHLIKRVRDEAHRFAIGYHRKLRSKRLFSR